MSRGAGWLMRVIGETLEAHPARRFTLADLAGLAWSGETITRARLVAVACAVKSLEANSKASPGSKAEYPPHGRRRHVKTVRGGHNEHARLGL
jgi:hypothetical protein